MGRFNRANRPYVRQRQNRVTKAGGGTNGARLASMAGLTDRPSVEQLERRQMLFALTVTADDVDPATGVGTVSAYFGYAIPYLITDIDVGTGETVTQTENFNDEAPGALGNGVFFLGSRVLTRHNLPPSNTRYAIQPPGADINERYLLVSLQNQTDFFSFQFFNDSDTNPQPISVSNVTFQIAPDGGTDVTGIDTDRVRVSLILEDVVQGTFTGAALRALITGNPALGTGIFSFDAPVNIPGFDTIRIEQIAPYALGGSPAFRLDNLTSTRPAFNFAQIVNSRLFGAAAFLSGPVGASAVFTDLYGRDMRRTIAVTPGPSGRTPRIDPDGNGVPNFNDGIGAIRLTGTDSRTGFSLWGGELTDNEMRPDDSDFFEAATSFKIVDSIAGLYGDFESAGFGYAFDVDNDTVEVTGLPPGPGSVIIGSPFIRNNLNNASYNPGGASPQQPNPVTTGFNNASQGIFVGNGASMGSVMVHGILHGSSRFTGFIDKLAIGYMVGSVTVEGDLGSLIVGSDAGQWVVDPGFAFTDPNLEVDPINKTASQLVVGRTVGEIAIAGRGLIDVTVVGDLSSPTTRPARDSFNYYERESIFGVSRDVDEIFLIRRNLDNTAFAAKVPTDLFRAGEQAVAFGADSWFHNDAIMGAEWVGSAASGVRIQGELSGGDVFNGEDKADVYAFAVDGTTEISIQGTNTGSAFAPYFRIVDQDGRTLAAPEGLTNSNTSFQVTVLKWKPTMPGVYYLVVGDPLGNDADTNVANQSYTIAMTGLATTTLGAYRTGGGSGFTDVATGEGNAVVVLAGSIGSLRIGTGLVDNTGGQASPTGSYNTTQSADDSMSFQGGTFSTPANLYNITTGSDIGAPDSTATFNAIDIRVGGDFGTLVTGLSPVAGGPSNAEGDANFITLTVGGRIASIDVRGGIGMDQDPPGDRHVEHGQPDVFTVVTGASGGKGDIGMIRVGFHVAGDAMSVRTSPGSVIGAVLISQDAYTDADPRSGVFLGNRGLPINVGAGSDVRFVDVPNLDLLNGVDIFTPLFGNQTRSFTDDAGSVVDISVVGAPQGAQVGTVRALPIDGSQGSAIAQIIVNLSGGSILRINGANASGGGLVSIGRIIVVGGGLGASIEITGSVEVDVWRIQGNGALDRIINTTPGGDIVAIDATSLNSVEVNGDLGRTQVPAWGPQLIGPFLGVEAGLVTAVGGTLGIEDARPLLDDSFNGDTFRPIRDDNTDDGNAYLDDIGSPLDGWLNGVVVRAGNLNDARAGGSVGDVILQDAAAVLFNVQANTDSFTALGRFDGIVGSIYSRDIVRVDVGNGLARPEQSPFATTGIYASDDIGEVVSSQASGVAISGNIIAANQLDPDLVVLQVDGVGAVTFSNGLLLDAHIAAEQLDGFWNSFNYGDEGVRTGDVGNVSLTNTNLFRSEVVGRTLSNLTLTNGYFDASLVEMAGNIGVVEARGFRNSTLNGEAFEVRTNSIAGARDLARLSAVEDITDLTLDIIGIVSESISAHNIVRSTIDVDNRLAGITVRNDIRASAIVVGELPTVTVARSIQSSSFSVSGALRSMTAGDRIANTAIEVTGPDGRIDTLTARTLISGSISATGPIGTVSVTAGDLSAAITTTGPRGTVTLLTATGDLDITGDISGTVGTLTAGRHLGAVGKTGVLLVRGDLATASIPNGQLYSDLRVGGTITGAVTVGGAIAKPNNNQVGGGSIIAFNRITSVVIGGDFDGDIISFSGGIGSIAINNGSFLPGNTIAAYDGDLTSVTITNGSLFGNVHADYNLVSLQVLGADGVFGDVGVNPASSALAVYDVRRNHLPPGVGINDTFQGARISASFDIVSVAVPNGSVFESSFVAGRVIRSISIGGSVGNDPQTLGQGSFFAAGDAIAGVTIGGEVANTAFVAGVVGLGSNNRPGGIGAAADVLKSGSIQSVTINGGARDTTFSAGIAAGTDGRYNTGDDRSVFGVSSIDTLALSGAITNVSAFGDTLSGSVAGDGRLILGGTNLLSTNLELDNGVGTPGAVFSGSGSFVVGDKTYTIDVSGPGEAYFDTATTRLTLRNTTSATNITVSSSTGVIDSLDVRTNDDASLGVVRFIGSVTGDSDLIVDGNVTSVEYGSFQNTGSVTIGGDATTLTFASLLGGFVSARTVQTIQLGEYGATNSAVFNEVGIQILSGGTINITGGARGRISVERSLTGLSVGGTVERSAFRFGESLGSFKAPLMRQTVLATGDRLGSVTIAGEVYDSAMMAGVDLGNDAAFGGAGLNADRLSTGSIGPVTIGGNFRESDLTAGYLRGLDGFFGTTDDNVAAGRSAIGTVTITGTIVGSTRLTESYRIASSGTLGLVKIGGTTVTGAIGNFAIETPLLAPLSIQVSDIRLNVDSRVFTANLVFNQPIDASSAGKALSVSEVRGTGEIEIRLIQGIDYTLKYDAINNTLGVVFSSGVTSSNLPVVPGEPGPGIYRFDLDQNIMRAKLVGVLIDGDGNGFSEAGDDFSGDAVVGDAGDKLVAESNFAGQGNTQRIDLYAPVNLDIVQDNNYTPDGLPDPNRPSVIRGFIGDHPDNDTNFFRFSGDVDLYSVTLQAGQILRLGALQGSAIRSQVAVLDASGVPLDALGDLATAISLPIPTGDRRDVTFPSTFLIKRTGTYIIAVGDSSLVATPGEINNPNPIPGSIGDYNLTMEVFDDGDSGFTSTTNAGNGVSVTNAPAPGVFAGGDGQLGTADDVPEIFAGAYRFTYSTGADGIGNTADDLVTGSNGAGITSTNNGAGRLVSLISTAIGPEGHAGVPGDVASDVDIFHLNNRNAITPGTRMRITVKLADLGADLGSASPVTLTDNRGSVQLAVFDTSSSVVLDDANMVFSPTDFLPNGGPANTVIADNGSSRYGYDANGDFFIEFVAPDRMGVPGSSGTFAVYVQGVYNTDYQLEVVTEGTGTITRATQNIYLETNGGSVGWLEAGGLTTSLSGFSARVLGFTGTINGQSADQYILSGIVTTLEALFQGAGFDVNVSTNPADFEFQPFSTVFLSATTDPLSPLFNSFSSFNFDFTSGTFFNTQPYGFSEHSDPLNTDLEDEAVVFLPSFSLQGLTPATADVDLFVQSATAAVARRVGELMGLRITDAIVNAPTIVFDPQAANSPDVPPGPGGSYVIPTVSRNLSDPFDSVERTNFFLGRQNSSSLLDKVLGRI